MVFHISTIDSIGKDTTIVASAPGKNPVGFDVYSTLNVNGGVYRFSYTIPPINTRTSSLPKLVGGLENVIRANGEEQLSVPKERTISDAIRAGVKLPVDQGQCGACWAIVVSQHMSDQIEIETRRGKRRGPLPEHEPSVTWSLSCFSRHDPCGGGDVMGLLKHARIYGIPSKTCSDLLRSRDVGGVDKNEIVKDMPRCGCQGKRRRHDVYSVASAVTPIFVGAKSKMQPEQTFVSLVNVVDIIKKYVLRRGSIIANLQLFTNILDGKFCFINGGVYLERVMYDIHIHADDEPNFSPDALPAGSHVGGHAVCIVGWGVASGIFVNPGERADVPYWLCRNSWGKTWGEDGFFKLACFPFNRQCQVEVPVEVDEMSEGGKITTVLAGGTVAFDTNVQSNVPIF